jgi:PleD family two-component response regulator
MYIRPSDVLGKLSVNNYGGVTYAIVDSSGAVLDTVGATSIFVSGDNLFTVLNESNLSKLTAAQIKLRAEKKTRMIFGAETNGENKIIVMAPIGVSDWQLVSVIRKEYFDTVVDNAMSNSRNMIIKLAVAILAFLIFLVVNSVVNRIKYGEQSKDLEDKADTDLLTGLNNKIATERKIQEYMTENPDSQCLMFLFDIDNFKKINDTMGHAFGDEVLQTLGHQLSNEFRVTDIIGRLGGDEFVLFLNNIKIDEQL